MLANHKPFAGKYRTRQPILPTRAEPPKPALRDTGPRPQSLNPAQSGFAPKPQPKHYTGTECIGITTLHKSNAVPVFNQQAAIDAAHMRR